MHHTVHRLILALVLLTATAPLLSAQEVVKPTLSQVRWAHAEWGALFHYDLHVFDNQRYNQQWNRNHPIEDVSIFNPDSLDTDEWIEAVAKAGGKFALLTAMHETGFALWQSDANPYCMRLLPWEKGRGDIVARFVASCRKYGVLPGLYVGIRWNSHLGVHDFAVDEGNTRITQTGYRRMCEKIVEELCSRYGELFMIWFDGGADDPAGLGPDVEPIVKRLQPQCLFYHNALRADVRWGGSESGMVGYPCYSTFPHPYSHRPRTETGDYLQLLSHGDASGGYWVPAMADTPLRGAAGRHEWFWEPDDENSLYSVEQLTQIYENSVGRNATLVLGLAPNPHGLLSQGDCQRLAQWRDTLQVRYGHPLGSSSVLGTVSLLSLAAPVKASRYCVQEDISWGERIRAYRVEAFTPQGWRVLDSGTAVGHKRIASFKAVTSSLFRLTVDSAVASPVITNFAIFE